jgi:hypothetical protein
MCVIKKPQYRGGLDSSMGCGVIGNKIKINIMVYLITITIINI